MEVLLELERLTKVFGGRRIFPPVSGRAQKGQVLAVLGPNGSGKSTLLRIICGLLEPTQGQVRIWLNGQPCSRRQRRYHLGYASPEVALYEELTAWENLEFFARVRGLPLAWEEGRQWLERVGLGGREEDWVGEFSSGMKQRLKLACAAFHRPALLVLDEPTTNLDEGGRQWVAALVEEQRRWGITVLATNDSREGEWGDVLIRLPG